MKNDTYTHCFYASELKYLKLRAFFFFALSTLNASFTALKLVVYRKCRHFTLHNRGCTLHNSVILCVCVCVKTIRVFKK